jgi:hypothetical protein
MDSVLTSIRVGATALSFAAETTWWDWPHGSATFFWNWPAEYQNLLRDGLAPRFIGDPPAYRQRQRAHNDPGVQAKERDKVLKVRRRGYIAPSRGPIQSLMNFFSVPKVTVYNQATGKDDILEIRMVYNGTSCGLNPVLWAPWFALPTGEQMIRTLDVGYWGADNDYGDMFLNFWLHDDLQRYCGVDLTTLFPEEVTASGRARLWETWTRPPMGLKPSPYQAVQGALVAKRLALGDPACLTNVFQWSSLELNLPGSASYRTGSPWISKRRPDGSIAVDVHSYVDDERVTGPTSELTWAGSSRLAKLCAHLGLQDAARKRREPSREPGPWAGVVAHTKVGEPVYKLVTQVRWDKTKCVLASITDLYAQGCQSGGADTWLPRGPLESARGFLIYVSRTYTSMIPYLKGLHLTIDSWQPHRDDDGWRLPCGHFEPQVDDGVVLDLVAPESVKAVVRLANDLRALGELTASAEPPRVQVRPTATAAAGFMFGDASGMGFGQSLWFLGRPDVDVFFGLWDESASSGSSNWREFYNQVLAVECGIDNGTIPSGTEIFLFTDNFVTERAFHRGTSSSKTLFELVLRLHKLEMHGKLFIHLVWVAGTRMIAQGTDGASRGDLSNGVMSGKDMLDFVPLDLGVSDRAPPLCLGKPEGGIGFHWNLRLGFMMFIPRMETSSGVQLQRSQMPRWNNYARRVTHALGTRTSSYVLHL